VWFIALKLKIYITDASGNIGNPGPANLAGTGPWVLGPNQIISGMSTQTYTLTMIVELDLDLASAGDNIYTECGSAMGGLLSSGQGLFNESTLDADNDGTIDEVQQVCGDIPHIQHTKVLTSVTQNADLSYDAIYTIEVCNTGGSTGEYTLTDAAMFEDDIIINSASFSSDIPSGSSLAPIPPPLGGWVLATDQSLSANVCHTFTVQFNVSLDLLDPMTPGNGIYDACGSSSSTNQPGPGQGLYNMSGLDVNGDGVNDDEVEACGDLPHLNLEKSLISLTRTGANDWTVSYEIEICNVGGAPGSYDLTDLPSFDDDIVINGANYGTIAMNNPGNPGPVILNGIGPWTLSNDQLINANECHYYEVNVDISMDLNDPATPGDGVYTACGSTSPGIFAPGEGLYNEARLDVNNDGIIDVTDDECVDIPFISHTKVFNSATQTGPFTYDVKYTLTVQNDGGASGNYSLDDYPYFDNDIIITAAEYMTDAVSNAGNPGPFALSVTGPWSLANLQSIAPGIIDTYMLTVSIEMDLQSASTPGNGYYTECGANSTGISRPGEGLHNHSALDLDNDGLADETDQACGDLPYLQLNKSIIFMSQTNATDWTVSYRIEVCNNGGAAGVYDLNDLPDFDDDIIINSATYTSTVVGNPGNAAPVNLTGTGPWNLANDEVINPTSNTVCHYYIVSVDVTLDLDNTATPGDGVYTACGSASGGSFSPGEGLFNQASLDINNDGIDDVVDDECVDISNLTLDKTISSVTQTGPKTWMIDYAIEVCNLGGIDGFYDLLDTPGFDDDVVINTASFTSDAPGNISNPGPTNLTGSGPWTFANDQAIAPGACQYYSLTAEVTMDLNDPSTPGDGMYASCESGTPTDPMAGEGLYNMTSLDANNDGIADLTDEVCEDLPAISHEKELTSITQTAPRTYEVKYTITVQNDGGVSGNYGLVDTPLFDDDVVITAAEYMSDATSNAGNPGPFALSLTGPWTLANMQSIAPGVTSTYMVTISVEMDLLAATTPGDGIYLACGTSTPGASGPGEGLHNESALDLDNDGMADETDTACGDLPDVHHEKTFSSVNLLADGSYDVVFTIEVTNCGGTSDIYSLSDLPAFDDDIVINSVSYTTDAIGNAGNPGPTILSVIPPSDGWVLASGQVIDGSCTTHSYSVNLNLSLDLTDGIIGDDVYSACASGTPGFLNPGEGLYNTSILDITEDGMADEKDDVCADLPNLTLDKSISSLTQTGPKSWTIVYEVEVCNNGGADGSYDLTDTPGFDSDIVINSVMVSSDATGNISNPGPTNLTGSGPWIFADDQNITAGTCQIYTLTAEVTMDLTDPATPGDGLYTACESGPTSDPAAGEGLYNMTSLDANNDGIADMTDEVCEDLPAINHEKTLTSITQVGARSYDVQYTVTVENNGGAAGTYGLIDTPLFDDDISINAAEYISDAVGNGANPGPFALSNIGPWSLATLQNILPGTTDTYMITLNVEMDLLSASTPGDGIYVACGTTSTGISLPGQGLHNETDLDLNNDGVADEEDSACGDLPDVHHEKTVSSVVDNADGTYTVVYNITVTNCGGVADDYNLNDLPGFDNDVEILFATYTTTAPGNAGPTSLPVNPPAGGWTLASAQNILGGCSSHSYDISVNVALDLMDGIVGDDVYTSCGSASANALMGGQGLYNQSQLDVTDDNVADEIDEVCADLPALTLEKTIDNVSQTGPRTWNIKYQIEVCNDGGADALYDLNDIPGFDDDIVITSAAYDSDATGNPGNPGPVTLLGSGPWVLSDDQVIAPGTCQIYSIDINVMMDLTDPSGPGDESYTACGTITPADLTAGEGLYNQTSLDSNNDGVADLVDEVCADLPSITHSKELTSITQVGARDYEVKYTMTVQNDGGAPGMYDLDDEIFFDDDILLILVL